MKNTKSMKRIKEVYAKSPNKSVSKNKPYQKRSIKERSFDDVGLKHDISSEAQDRSEDLINEVDPFIQQPENVKKVIRISERPL